MTQKLFGAALPPAPEDREGRRVDNRAPVHGGIFRIQAVVRLWLFAASLD